MSTPNPQPGQTASGAAAASTKTWWKACALKIDDSFLGGKGLGLQTDIDTVLLSVKNPEGASWLGFSITFPLSDDLPCYQVDRSLHGSRSLVPSGYRKLLVRFPTGGITTSVAPIDPTLQSNFPTTKSFSQLDVRVNAPISVEGFGLPFANPGHPSEGWVNLNRPILQSITLLDLFSRREFCFVVGTPDTEARNKWTEKLLPPPFSYPYGNVHQWDLKRYRQQLPQTRGAQFRLAWGFQNDNDHLAVLTQSQVQDAMYLDDIAHSVARDTHHCYSIQLRTDGAYYVVVPDLSLSEDLQLQVLKENCSLRVNLYDNERDTKPARWDAQVIESPIEINFLASSYGIKPSDLILSVSRPHQSETTRRPDFIPKLFADCRVADEAFNVPFDDYARKVNAVCAFHPDARPTNVVACGVQRDVVQSNGTIIRAPIPEHVAFSMSLQRDLLLGTGFWRTLRCMPQFAARSQRLLQAPQASLLPVVNLLDVSLDFLGALLQSIPQTNRARFQRYLSFRQLGLGVLASDHGFSATRELAAATLGMRASIGKVICTAPTDLAADNFSDQLDTVSHEVADQFNRNKGANDPRFAHRCLVLRGFDPKNELAALKYMLRNLHVGNGADPFSKSRTKSTWRLRLSPTYWLLVAMGSPGVRTLSSDDHPGLHSMRSKLQQNPRFARLLGVARGEISWTEYNTGVVVPDSIFSRIFDDIVKMADIVCITPAVSNVNPFLAWKNEQAKAVAVHEADKISRPDWYCVWGNTLLPCLVSGNGEHPFMDGIAVNVKSKNGHSANRLGQDGCVTPLAFLKAIGWPIYRVIPQQ